MYSPAQARRLLPTMATETGAGDQLWVRTYKSLELRSGCEGNKLYLQLESKLSTLEDLAKLLPMRTDFQDVLKNGNSNYMPQTGYDSNGSTYTKFAGGYGRLRHVMPITDGADIEYFSRVHLVDLLLADGWEPLGFSSNAAGPGGVDTAELVETWIKREKHFSSATK